MRIEKLLKEVSAIETNPFTITPLKAAILILATALYFVSSFAAFACLQSFTSASRSASNHSA